MDWPLAPIASEAYDPQQKSMLHRTNGPSAPPQKIRSFDVGNQVLISSHRMLLSSVRWARCGADR
jgi:hypothetical protein